MISTTSTPRFDANAGAPPLAFDLADRRGEPFPHAVRQHILPPFEFEQLRSEFPESQFLSSQHAAHRSLRRSSPHFRLFLEQAPAWTRFVAQLNRREFVDQCLALFADELGHYGADIDHANYRFSERADVPYRTRERSLANAYYYVHRGIERSSPRRWLNEWFGRDELYLQVTLARAEPGYAKQIHRDRPHQLVLMLFYFDDLEDCGGELQLYRRRDEVLAGNVDRRRVPEDIVQPVATVPCRANSGVIILNTPDSYHSVSTMTATAPRRRFLGIAICKRFTRDAWPGAAMTARR